MPRPAYIAALGIAVMSLWGFWLLPGMALVGMAGCMNPETKS